MVASILLTPNNMYCTKSGELPKRPTFDKDFFGKFVKNFCVSEGGYDMLPPSMKKHVKVNSGLGFGNVPIRIKEIARADILIVVNSPEEIEDGLEFRLDDFELLESSEKFRIYLRV